MLIDGLDPGGATRPIQVDDNGNLSVDIVSGVSVSTTFSDGSLIQVLQLSGSAFSVATGPTSLDVQQVSGSSWSVAVTGSTGTQVIIGDVDADVADTGEAPVKMGGIGRTTNPTAVADGDRVSSSFDDLGRQVMTPYQVRDLVVTSYVALANGTETALLAGAASTFHDLVHVVCANTSDAAIDLTFRTGTAGSAMFVITAPADATAGFVPAVPVPQTELAQAWTVDMADVSGTTVHIHGLFIKNV